MGESDQSRFRISCAIEPGADCAGWGARARAMSSAIILTKARPPNGLATLRVYCDPNRYGCHCSGRVAVGNGWRGWRRGDMLAPMDARTRKHQDIDNDDVP